MISHITIVLVIGLAFVGTSTFAQSFVEGIATTQPLNGQGRLEPDAPDRERQERIREHNERISKIIEANYARRAQQIREKLDERRNVKPGWVVRVAEGLTRPEKERLVRQLTSDGFSPLVIPAEPSPDSKQDPLELHDVLLHFGDTKASAMAAEEKLRRLGYQFHSVRFGKLVEQIVRPEVADAEGSATESLTSPTLSN